MKLINITRALLIIALSITCLEATQADGTHALCNGDNSASKPATTTVTPVMTPETTAPPTTATPTTTPLVTTNTFADDRSPDLNTSADGGIPGATAPPPTTQAPTTATPAPTTPADLFCLASDPLYAKCVAAFAKSSRVKPDSSFTTSVAYQHTDLALWECINACADQMACVAYSYESSESACDLYVIASDTIRSAGGLTGTLLAPKSACALSLDTKFVGFDLSEAPGASFETCCARCEMDDDCSAFTFTTDSVCQLKTAVRDKQTAQYVISGIWKS